MFKSLRVALALFLSAVALPLITEVSASAASKPTCIVSLSPTATETLFAIGAGKQVQAVDEDSDYPTGLPKKRINALDPSVEAVVGICKTTSTHSAKPDLVVISYDEDVGLVPIGYQETDQPVLRATGVLVLLEEAHLRDLGRTSGHEIGIAVGIDTTTERESDDERAKDEQAKTKLHKPLGAGEATLRQIRPLVLK